MKCERIREIMSAYIDNEINEVDKAKFEKHLAQCPQCKEEYQLLLDVVNECSEIDEVELPEDFREELHNKLLQAKESKSRGLSDFIRRNKWKVYSGTAAAAVLILALSFNALNTPKADLPMAKGAAPNTGIQYDYSRSFGAADAGAASHENTSKAIAPSAPSVAPTPTVTQFSESTANQSTIAANPAPTSDSDTRMQALTIGPTAKTAIIDAERKIIKNGNISLKVKDVQGRINDITVMTEQMGGYVENSSVNDIPIAVKTVPEGVAAKEDTTKIGSITIKVPADKFESTFQSLLTMGEVQNQSTNSNDITKEYMDLESRMNNLKIQEKTYQDLLAKTQNVEEILKVENEINRLRTEIDIMQGDLKRWNDQVEYSTIYVNLTEVKEAELEKVDTSSVWQRARQGLINTVNNMKNGIAWLFVFIVSSLPYIFVLGAGSIFAIYLIRKRKK